MGMDSPRGKQGRSQFLLPGDQAGDRDGARMLGTDKSRGYCLEMIWAHFLAGAHLDNGNPKILLNSIVGCTGQRTGSLINALFLSLRKNQSAHEI